MNSYLAFSQAGLTSIFFVYWLILLLPVVLSTIMEEQRFIDNFKNGRWNRMRRAYREPEEVLEFVTTMHEAAFFVRNVSVNIIALFTGTLLFSRDVNYPPMKIDVLEYAAGENMKRVYYITKGYDDQSVHYLTKLNTAKLMFIMRRFVPLIPESHPRPRSNRPNNNLPVRQTSRPRRTYPGRYMQLEELFEQPILSASPIKPSVSGKAIHQRGLQRIFQPKNFGLA